MNPVPPSPQRAPSPSGRSAHTMHGDVLPVTDYAGRMLCGSARPGHAYAEARKGNDGQ
jgi:hypothetical protein